jgi:CBS domain-containing protein
VVLKNKASKKLLFMKLWTKELITITPADKIDDCMELMSTKKIRHLPVIDNQIVVGIISMGDVVKAIIEIQKTTIEHLDSYISQ